jgi:hypothetical protein
MIKTHVKLPLLHFEMITTLQGRDTHILVTPKVLIPSPLAQVECYCDTVAIRKRKEKTLKYFRGQDSVHVDATYVRLLV